MIWYLLHGITLHTSCMERNEWVFNKEEWHEFKLIHLIWDDLIMYVKVAWTHMVKLIDISVDSYEGFLRNFDDLGGH